MGLVTSCSPLGLLLALLARQLSYSRAISPSDPIAHFFICIKRVWRTASLCSHLIPVFIYKTIFPHVLKFAFINALIFQFLIWNLLFHILALLPLFFRQYNMIVFINLSIYYLYRNRSKHQWIHTESSIGCLL